MKKGLILYDVAFVFSTKNFFKLPISPKLPYGKVFIKSLI